ncbi:baseplate assembly protein [Laribacter hongkongensis]|uniref:baseplate assembly protein n=1 Tax=Laribacter hongkongensis TaxID=168471 RepID=UPI0035716A83
MTRSLIDLSMLPPPDVVEAVDLETLLDRRKAALLASLPEDMRESVANTLSLESEPLTKLLEENAYRELLLRQRINEAARAVMLPYAGGSDLEQLAANVGVARLLIDPGKPDAWPPVPPTRETDDSLRTRAQMAFEGLSVAGPRAAYVWHALSADGRVADVDVHSPEPCEVVVTVLAQAGNGAAGEDLLAIVRAALSAETLRPIGDRLTVQGATIVDYRIDATLLLESGPESEPVIKAARLQAEAYVSRQRRIGRDIDRSALFAALHVEGVKRVELRQPAADMRLERHQAGHCTAIELGTGTEDA